MSFGLRRKVESRQRYFSNRSSMANDRRYSCSRRSSCMESNFSLRPAQAVPRQVSDRGNDPTTARPVDGLIEIVESFGRLRLYRTRDVHQAK
jgi:hypothetical protein